MDLNAILWLVLIVGFLFVEAATVAMVSLWFAIGALAAMVVSLLGLQTWIQVVVFLVVSGIMLLLLRPLSKRYFTPKLLKTNADAVLDSVGRVTIAIDNVNATGQVKLGAMEWTARSADGQPIPAGTMVKVEKIEGVKVLVVPIPEPVSVK